MRELDRRELEIAQITQDSEHKIMKTKQIAGRRAMGTGLSLLLLTFILQVSSLTPLLAAPFDCGSTGTNGVWNITQSTNIALPPDGIFHCTTITVAQGVTVTFARNSLNTPVYLLATGDVTINGTISLDADGRVGGPGGFDGGYGSSPYVGQNQSGDGCGPGGAKSGVDPQGHFANVYGNLLLVPLIGGSGGAGINGGGGMGGGGAIMIASNSRIKVAGSVRALGWGMPYMMNGGPSSVLAGSGGGIRLVAPIVEGTGFIDVQGGASDLGYGGLSLGRIRIDCTDNQAYRSLHLTGVASRGMRMVVLFAAALDILEVGGQTIAAGTNSAVIIELPIGASTNQTVKVQARNFTNDVPIRVVITPEHGSRGEFDATILQSSGNPPFAIVPVVIPTGSACQVHAWTR